MENAFKYCPRCRHMLLRQKVDGRQRKLCRNCGWIDYKNPLPVAVCAVLNKKGEMLITRRNTEPGYNKWALPGGFVESNETPEKACLRELKEETGVRGEINMLTGVYVQKTRKYGFILVIGYVVRALEEAILLNDELKEARFFAFKDIPFIPFASHRKIIEKISKGTL